MSSKSNLSENIQAAYKIVSDAKITETEIKLRAFEYAYEGLRSSMKNKDLISGEGKSKNNSKFSDSEDPIDSIAVALSIDTDQAHTIFYMDDENLKLSLPPKKMPSSAAAKVREITLLLVVGRKLAGMGSETDYEIIRAECSQYGCLDRNFATHVKGLAPTIRTKSGKGSGQSADAPMIAHEPAKELILKYTSE